MTALARLPLSAPAHVREEVAALLRGIGATHVLNSRVADFPEQLQVAVDATGATAAFDPSGGGPLATQIMQAMERTAARSMATYSRYGSETFKQLYIYGTLDPSPLILDRLSFGFAWSVSGWFLPFYLNRIGEAAANTLRQRVPQSSPRPSPVTIAG